MGLPGLVEEFDLDMRVYRCLALRGVRYSFEAGLSSTSAAGRARVVGGMTVSGDGDRYQGSQGQGRDASPSSAVASKAGSPSSRNSRRTEEPRMTQVSKALTQVLRHKAANLGLHIRPDGYIVLDEVLCCSTMKKYKPTLEEIQAIVKDSNKQRFTLMEDSGSLLIRANQGHSMKEVQDELLLERLQLALEGGAAAMLPAQVVHGTYLRYWPSILERGLLAGGIKGEKFRNHVHFATGLPQDGNVISGMRESCELAIYLDVERALDRGLPLYRSANEVILSPGFDGAVPVELFLRAIRLKDGAELWPQSST